MKLASALDTTPDAFLVGTALHEETEWQNVAEILRGMNQKQLAVAKSLLKWVSEEF